MLEDIDIYLFQNIHWRIKKAEYMSTEWCGMMLTGKFQKGLLSIIKTELNTTID